jgi:hypothetical protein
MVTMMLGLLSQTMPQRPGASETLQATFFKKNLCGVRDTSKVEMV